MQYIKSVDYKQSASDLADRIVKELAQNKRVLWILTGGSSIQSCVEVQNILKSKGADLKKVTVTLTDERYGEVGHKDSSWQKLRDYGFDFDSVNAIPVLVGLSLDETYKNISLNLSRALTNHDIVISQFGVGGDVHIAGILPKSEGAKSLENIVMYQGPDFMRITLGFEGIKKIDAAYVFMFGESKKQALTSLMSSDVLPFDEPAQILKSIKEVFVYSDQI